MLSATGAASLAFAALPIILGITLQRCIPKMSPKMDRAVQPTSLLVTFISITLATFNFWRVRALLSWDVLVSSALLPVSALALGAILTAALRLKITSAKAVMLTVRV